MQTTPTQLAMHRDTRHIVWRGRDSNPDDGDMNPVCFLCITPQCSNEVGSHGSIATHSYRIQKRLLFASHPKTHKPVPTIYGCFCYQSVNTLYKKFIIICVVGRGLVNAMPNCCYCWFSKRSPRLERMAVVKRLTQYRCRITPVEPPQKSHVISQFLRGLAAVLFDVYADLAGLYQDVLALYRSLDMLGMGFGRGLSPVQT